MQTIEEETAVKEAEQLEQQKEIENLQAFGWLCVSVLGLTDCTSLNSHARGGFGLIGCSRVLSRL